MRRKPGWPLPPGFKRGPLARSDEERIKVALRFLESLELEQPPSKRGKTQDGEFQLSNFRFTLSADERKRGEATIFMQSDNSYQLCLTPQTAERLGFTPLQKPNALPGEPMSIKEEVGFFVGDIHAILDTIVTPYVNRDVLGGPGIQRLAEQLHARLNSADDR